MNSLINMSETSKNLFLFVFILSFASSRVCIYVHYLLDAVINQISNRKSHQKNMLRERTFSFDQ